MRVTKYELWGAQALAKVLPDTSITTLYLGLNLIGDARAQALADALPKTSITSLSLKSNQIGAAGAQALAKVLPDTSITSLNLGNNQIRNAGAQALAEALHNTSITSLNLQSNQIGDVGVQDLAKVLPGTSITTLNLGSNQIGDAGAQDLAEALPKTSITSLDLRDNLIGDARAQALAEALPDTNILKYNNTNTELHKTLTDFIDKSKSNEYSEILSDCELILNKNAALSELLKGSKYSGEDYNKLKYLVANTDHIEQFIEFLPFIKTAKNFSILDRDTRDEVVKSLIGVKDDEGINDFYDFAWKVAPMSMSIWNSPVIRAIASVTLAGDDGAAPEVGE